VLRDLALLVEQVPPELADGLGLQQPVSQPQQRLVHAPRWRRPLDALVLAGPAKELRAVLADLSTQLREALALLGEALAVKIDVGALAGELLGELLEAGLRFTECRLALGQRGLPRRELARSLRQLCCLLRVTLRGLGLPRRGRLLCGRLL